MLLTASANPIQSQSTEDALLWLLLLLVMVLLGGIVVLAIRRRYQDSDHDELTATFSLSSLRQMRDRGELTAEEFKYGLKSAGYTAKEIEELFAKADTDGDQTISKNEFLAWYAEGLSDEEGEDEEE